MRSAPGRTSTAPPTMAIVNLYCTSCESQIGIFENEWIRLTTSYAWPKQKGTHFGTEIGNKTQTVPPNSVQNVAEGCEMADVFCCSCHATVGRYCKAAPSKEQQYLADKYFYKFSRVHFKNAQTFHLVDPIFGFGEEHGHSTKAAPKSSQRDVHASSGHTTDDAREIREDSWSPDDSPFEGHHYQLDEHQTRKSDRHIYDGLDDYVDDIPPVHQARRPSTRPNRQSLARQSNAFLDGANSRRATSQLSPELSTGPQTMPAPLNRTNRDRISGAGAAPMRRASTAKQSQLVHDRHSMAPTAEAGRKATVIRLNARNLEHIESTGRVPQTSADFKHIDNIDRKTSESKLDIMQLVFTLGKELDRISSRNDQLHELLDEQWSEQDEQMNRLDARMSETNDKLDVVLNRLQEIPELLRERYFGQPLIGTTQDVPDQVVTTPNDAFSDVVEMQRTRGQTRAENKSTSHQTRPGKSHVQSPDQASDIDRVVQKKRTSRATGSKRKRQATYGPRKRSSLRNRASKTNEHDDMDQFADMNEQQPSLEQEDAGHNQIEDQDISQTGLTEDVDAPGSAQATMATVLNGVVKSRGSKTALSKQPVSDDDFHLGTEGELADEDSLFLPRKTKSAAVRPLAADEDNSSMKSILSSEQQETKTNELLTPSQPESLGEAIDFSDEEPVLDGPPALPEHDPTLVRVTSFQTDLDSLVDVEETAGEHATSNVHRTSTTSLAEVSAPSKRRPRGKKLALRRQTVGVDAVSEATAKESKSSRRKTMPQEPPSPKQEKFPFHNFTPDSFKDGLRTSGRPEALTQMQEDEIAQTTNIVFKTTTLPLPTPPPPIQRLFVQAQGYDGNQFGRTLAAPSWFRTSHINSRCRFRSRGAYGCA